eukprot:scaffold219866_cov31-Prasinocladus_malaysianus.AAC.1
MAKVAHCLSCRVGMSDPPGHGDGPPVAVHQQGNPQDSRGGCPAGTAGPPGSVAVGARVHAAAA